MKQADRHMRNAHNRVRAVLIALVFVLFTLNAVGLTDIRLMLDGAIGINSQVITQLSSGRILTYLAQPDFAVFFAITATLAISLPLLSPIRASLLTFCCMLPPFYIAWAFPIPPPTIPLDYTLLTILMLFSVNVLSSYFIESHRRQQIVSAFGQYVPPLVVDQLSRDPDAFSMAGTAREMSVLFCDIKGFSKISEQLSATELAAMLNVYLTAMTDVLHASGATIDKYMGDAIMAFWGAPLSQVDHATRAVDAALAMQQRMLELRAEFVQRGWPALSSGIGLSSGVMSVGNMGSRYRIAYTVLGDSVNLAARLEALTRLYDVDILVDEATCRAARRYRYREIDHVRVRGKAHSARLFQPLRADQINDAVLTLQDDALQAYYAGEWETARARLAELTSAGAHDGWSAVLAERMTSGPCPPDWSGIINFHGELSYSVGSD